MPDDALLHFTDPLELQERIRPTEAEVIVGTRGAFRGELAQMGLPQVTVRRGWQSLPVVCRGEFSKSRYVIAFLTDPMQTDMHVNGKEAGPDQIFLISPGEEHLFRFPANCVWASLVVTRAVLEAGNAVFDAHGCGAGGIGMGVLQPSAARLARLRALHSRAVALMQAAPEYLSHPEVVRSVDQAMMHALANIATDPAVRAEPAGARHKKTALMRRFSAALKAHDGKPVYMADLCGELGVSGRWLRLVCLEFLGMPPHRYLHLRRMHLARRALVIADPQETTVTTVATDLGFWELGRFAVNYRQLFGEKPSATLRRPRRRAAA